MAEVKKQYSDMAPGMSQTIYAGDELTLRDNDGNEFSIIAKEAEETMAFLKAFDLWFVASQTSAIRGDYLDGFWVKLKRAYNALPASVQSELPSLGQGAIILPVD